MRGSSQFRAYRLKMPCDLDSTPKIQMQSGEVVMLRPWDRIIGEPVGRGDSIKILAINGELCEINEYCPWRELEVLGTDFTEYYTTFALANQKIESTDKLYWYTGDKMFVVDADTKKTFILERGDLVVADMVSEYHRTSKVSRINNKSILGNLEIDKRFLQKFNIELPFFKV